MNFQPSISPNQKAKKAFIHNGRKDTFIKKNTIKNEQFGRKLNHENKANTFAQSASENPSIVSAFLQNKNDFKPNSIAGNRHKKDEMIDLGMPLEKGLLDAFKIHFGVDFTEVKIHANPISTKIAKQYNAAALTVNEHIFLNIEVYNPNTIEGLLLLSHELFHTLNPDNQSDTIEVQLKPLTELNDQTPEQKLALQRATKIAMGEKGKVNSSVLNEDKTRVGWQYLLEYFKTTMGEDAIVADKKDYKAGKFLEENIKYQKRGTATKIKVVDGVHTQVVDKNADLLPSWCGIFVFWAYHKSGIHPPFWEMGKPNFTSKDAYKKGEYLPRPGDLVIKNGYNHHAMVVRTDPETIVDTKDLQSVKVTTINGNTAGTNHTGGQIQEKTDAYSYWDYYIKPFFAGVNLTPEADFKLDERLKESMGEKASSVANSAGNTSLKNPDLTVNQYDTKIEPVASLDLPKAEGEKLEKPEKVEEPKLSPKEIMAKDLEYKELNRSLDKNAEKEKVHDTPENKAGEAQRSAISPPTEALGKAKANKVEKLGDLPKPKEFKAEELKKNILAEVEKLIKEKSEQANESGSKPKINQDEITDLKDKNQKDIATKKNDSIGPVEKEHKLPPNESAVEARKNADIIIEDPGAVLKVPHPEKAVAKPINEERITLEEDSAKIDQKMADNEVDEQQLEESNEEKFTSSLSEKRGSQAEAGKVKEDYRAIEEQKLDKDKKIAKATVTTNVDKIHEARKGEFGNVDTVKDKTKTADEAKRKEITGKIEKLYSDSELSVTTKLAALETTVSQEFDGIMATANTHFKDNVNKAMDDEFTWEWAAKKLDRADFNRRVGRIFDNESKKFKKELSDALNPLTNKIADTLNAIMLEIQTAKKAVIDFVNGLEPGLEEIGMLAAKGVLEKFGTLETSVNEKQEALTNNLAKKYADGVMNLEAEFKKIMDSRKSWLEKALDAIIDAIKEIINLLLDLKKALERAAEYGKRIIKAPLKFLDNLVAGATAGFNNFVKNIGKHLLQGALEWVTGELGDAGIVLPEKFDFKGILSIILQVLGISLQNIKEIAKKVIGEKYVNMLEKGVDMGVKVGDKILQIFTIIKNEGIAGLWEFIKEQFNDLKEKMMEEAKSFIITTIVEVAVVKVVSMLIPGAGFISAVKSLIDFLRTLFAKARQIVNIITGIIDTFGEILAGNVAKVSTMVENVLAKFLGLAITFLAAILGLGKIGKKINDIIQKKIKDPINKAITKMMEKLKTLMTKLGIFKFLDKAEAAFKKGKKYVEDKKDQAIDKAKSFLKAIGNFIKNKFKKTYTEKDGSTHTLQFNDKMELERHSITRDLGNYLLELSDWVNVKGGFKKKEIDDFQKPLKGSVTEHGKIRKLIGEAVTKARGGEYEGPDKYFSQNVGTQLVGHLSKISGYLRELPALNSKEKNKIPKTQITYPTQRPGGDGEEANAPFISLDSKYIGSKADSARNDSDLTKKVKKAITNYGGSHHLVKGHLINHELHGTGAEIHNLGPIPISGNNHMLQNFEEKAKELVHSNQIISVYVKYNYGKPKIDIDTIRPKVHKRNTAAVQKKGDDLIEAMDKLSIPKSVKYKVEDKVYNGKSDDDQTEIDKTKNWKPGAYLNENSFSFNHDDFF
ncbi:MAG: DUF4157 domain-containing protein [Bacteroidota bacterium]